jgi:hypothetical protein
MPSPNLDRLCSTGVLHAEPSVADEFAGLMRSGIARLRDARNKTLALESRFDLAYNAAHALCLAALRWHSEAARKSIASESRPGIARSSKASPRAKRCISAMSASSARRLVEPVGRVRVAVASRVAPAGRRAG